MYLAMKGTNYDGAESLIVKSERFVIRSLKPTQIGRATALVSIVPQTPIETTREQ